VELRHRLEQGFLVDVNAVAVDVVGESDMLGEVFLQLDLVRGLAPLVDD